jgi:hypothetical protein
MKTARNDQTIRKSFVVVAVIGLSLSFLGLIAQTTSAQLLMEDESAFLEKSKKVIGNPKFQKGGGWIKQTRNDESAAAIYNDSKAFKWKDYTFQGEFASEDNDQWGMMFRVQKNVKGYYLFQISQQGWVRFQKSNGGDNRQTLGLDKISVQVQRNWQGYKVEVVKDTFTGYVGGEKVAESKDSKYKQGTIGIHTESHVGRIRSLRVVSGLGVEPTGKLATLWGEIKGR